MRYIRSNHSALLLGLLIGVCSIPLFGFFNGQDKLSKNGLFFSSGFPEVDGFGLHPSAIITATTTTTVTLVAKDSGKLNVFSGTTGASKTYNLPAARAGLFFPFVDLNPSAAGDLTIDPATGDKIDGQTAGVTIVLTGDAAKEYVGLLAVDTTNWIVVGVRGTLSTGS